MAPSAPSFSNNLPAATSPFNRAAASASRSFSARPPVQAFGSSSSRGPSASDHAPHNGGDGWMRSTENEEYQGGTLYLEPSAYPRNAKGKWKSSGRTLLAAVNPTGGEVAAWVSKAPSGVLNKPPTLSNPKLELSEKTIIFTSPHVLSDHLISFYTETYTLFASLQRIVASGIRLPSMGRKVQQAEVWDQRGKLLDVNGILGPPGAETIGHMRRLVTMYLEELARLRDTSSVNGETKARYEAVFSIFQLAQILYLPQDGRGEGLLGEELLDWVNDVDPAPDNNLGNEIMSAKDPWEHPSFWPYVNRCLLRGFHLPASSFLRTLAKHPHEPLSKLAVLLSTHLSLFPRSHNTTAYPLDHQFLSAHRTWLAKFRAELSNVTAGRPRGRWLNDGGAGGSDFLEWEEDLSTIVDLMEGRANAVLSEVADWREAIGAWGLLVDVGMRRDDLREIMRQVLDKIPPDPTVLDDTIQSCLCSGEIIKALTGCHDLDIWLAAHLSDVLDKLLLIPDDEERFELFLRDYFLLEYSDMLQDNPKGRALWRITCDYMAAAGDEGRKRLRSYITHVSLGSTSRGKAKEVGMPHDEATEVEESSMLPHLQMYAELREACVEMKLDDEWRTISKIMADLLLRTGDFGLAAAIFLEAEDGFALSHLAEKILDEYIRNGEVEYLRYVESLPPTLLSEAPLALSELQLETGSEGPFDLSGQTSMSMFASRLAFLSEFRDYLLFIGQGAKEMAAERLVKLVMSGIAPIGFWAVLLVESVPLLEDADILFTSNDTFELMRILQEVATNSTFAPGEYLDQLVIYLQRQEKAEGENRGPAGTRSKGTALAMRKLEEVRLALARNLARAVVVGLDNPF